MNKFIVENGNNYYYKTYSLLITDAPIDESLLQEAEERTYPTRFSSTGGHTMKRGLELMGFKCEIEIEESDKSINSDNLFVYRGNVGNY